VTFPNNGEKDGALFHLLSLMPNLRKLSLQVKFTYGLLYQNESALMKAFIRYLSSHAQNTDYQGMLSKVEVNEFFV